MRSFGIITLAGCKNEVYKLQNQQGVASFRYLNEDEFRALNGERPWVTINAILRSFGTVDYEIVSPEGQDIFKPYLIQLRGITNKDLFISFQSLSSGERILLALVVAVYNFTANLSFPKLVLLDEIDATLHPSMSRNLLDVMNQIFIPKGACVILATHSPSTVALAGESSLLVMERAGEQRLRRTSKEEALSILTEGFATLEEGIMIFDQISSGDFFVISEGSNINLIRKALELHSIHGVNFVDGIQDITGKNQLKTFYDYMVRVPHKSKILFVWDCDAKHTLKGSNNTFPFIFEFNEANSIAKSGIENLFPPSVFDKFATTTVNSRGEKRVAFDNSRKKDFGDEMLQRGVKEDFDKFKPLLDEIVRVQKV